jgi:hypothetical protein
MGTWRPLLDGEQARRARSLVDEIAGRLTSPAVEPGLSDAAGRALLFAYLGNDDASDAQLDAALSHIDELGPSLFTGIAGLAFVLAHLGHDVDESVDEGLAASLAHVHHDLVLGVAGIGVYALERAGSTRLLGRVIETLDAQAAPAKVGRALFTPVHRMGLMRETYPQGATDLGVAHGQGAAIVVTGAAAAHGIPRARQLHDDLVAFLWSTAREAGDARFAAVAESMRATRSAWCYGDPGLAAALFATASALGDAAGQARALELARLAARRPVEATLATEASLCHGALGLAHIYNRLAQASGDSALAAAARDWYERGLAMALPEGTDLLEGQLGVALALLAAITGDEPAWDRALAITAG